MKESTPVRNGTERRSVSLPFKQVVRLRRSCRPFLSTPVPEESIKSVLEDAQQSLSNCNTQPWNTHIVSGEKLKVLSAAILKVLEAEGFTPDVSFDIKQSYGRYGERQQDQGKGYYESIGVAWEDKAARKAALQFIREALNVQDELKILFGIPFGYADLGAPDAGFKLCRDAIGSSVTFHQ